MNADTDPVNSSKVEDYSFFFNNVIVFINNVHNNDYVNMLPFYMVNETIATNM